MIKRRRTSAKAQSLPVYKMEILPFCGLFVAVVVVIVDNSVLVMVPAVLGTGTRPNTALGYCYCDSLNLVTNCVDSTVTQKWYALRPQLIMTLDLKWLSVDT